MLIKLNKVRKYDTEKASIIARQLLDNCLISSGNKELNYFLNYKNILFLINLGINTDTQKYMERINVLMSEILDHSI